MASSTGGLDYRDPIFWLQVGLLLVMVFGWGLITTVYLT